MEISFFYGLYERIVYTYYVRNNNNNNNNILMHMMSLLSDRRVQNGLQVTGCHEVLT